MLITCFLCEMVGQIYPFPSGMVITVLSTGVLRLELDKESYQRSGLQGQPVPGGGRKHVKARYRTFDWCLCFLESESNQDSDRNRVTQAFRVAWKEKLRKAYLCCEECAESVHGLALL